MRVPTYLISLVAIIAMLCLTGGVASADPPGANGTVKVHEYPEHKNGSENANDPKVCRFEIHGNNFDSAQTGRWWIQEHKWGNGDSTKAVAPIGTRTYTANASGDWTDNNGGAGFTLADGHYKLFVEMKHAAGNSGSTVVTYKHKVFKIDCPATGGGSNNGGSNNGGSNNGGSNNGGTGSTGGGNNGGTGSTGTTGGTSNDVRVQYVCVAGMRTQQTFVNGSLAAVTTTSESCNESALEAGPTGNVIVIVEGVQSAGVLGQQSAPAISQLPATSTAAGTAGLAIGFVAISAGLALLRRRTAAH